jgi:hypothetical protein
MNEKDKEPITKITPHLQLEISIENDTFNCKMFFMIIFDFTTKKTNDNKSSTTHNQA